MYQQYPSYFARCEWLWRLPRGSLIDRCIWPKPIGDRPCDSTTSISLIADLYEPPKEALADADRRPEAVYLYGVDLMSTGEVMGYFGDYAPNFVEWVNDSSCELGQRL